MSVSPELILFFIRGVIKLGSAARGAYEQKVRDQDIPLPKPLPASPGPLGRAPDYFKAGKAYHDLVLPGGILHAYWQGDSYINTDEAKAVVSAIVYKIEAELQSDTDWRMGAHGDTEGAVVLAQWADGSGPPHPWLRIAMAAADVALDYLAVNPGLLAKNSNGEKFVTAVANSINTLLPDPTDKSQLSFVERLVAAVLEGGFRTLSEQSGTLTKDAHWSALIAALAKPVADAYRKSTTAGERMRWIYIRDYVLPDMAEAAVGVLITHQKEFLGRELDPKSQAGALTQALLVAIKDGGMFSNPGDWMAIYRALLKAVVDRAGIIVPGTGKDDQLYRELLTGIAGAMKDWNTPFGNDWEIDLAVASLDALNKAMPLRSSDPWGKLAIEALKGLIAGTATGLRDGDALERIFSREMLRDIIASVVAEIGRTPTLITGSSGSAELQAVVAAVATAMSKDTHLLLTAANWQIIVGVAAAEAARNPARLFKIDAQTPEEQLGVILISRMLARAAASFNSTGRSGGFVLFGETLMEAISTTLKEAAGNAERAMRNDSLQALDTLCDRLNDLATTGLDGTRIGAAEWLWLFRKLVAGVLDSGKLEYTTEQLRDMLYEGART